jgi:hypothetical protein
MKLYSRDPEEDDIWDEKLLFKGWDSNNTHNEFYTDYLLHIHLFMGRNFPPADETGGADPFVMARSMGKKIRSRVKNETLNPGWFETLEMQISVPPIVDKDVG